LSLIIEGIAHVYNSPLNVESAVSGYKDALAQKEKEVHELHRQLGKRMVELDWVSKKLKSLVYNDRKSMIDTNLKAPAVVRQCELLSIKGLLHAHTRFLSDNGI